MVRADLFLSLILPVYNVAEYLPTCLDSILSQDADGLEVVAVDDGSTDDSGDILDHYASRSGKIRVIHQRNQGVGAARNSGISAARGEYLWFVDPDDWIEPHSVRALAAAIRPRSTDIAVFGFRTVGPGSQPPPWPFNEARFAEDQKERAEIFRQLVAARRETSSCNKIYSKSFLMNTGVRFSDARYGEDAIFNYRAFRVVETVLALPDIWYVYRLRPESVSRKYDPTRWSEKELGVIKEMKLLLASLGEAPTLANRRFLWGIFREIRMIARESPDKIGDLRALRANEGVAEMLRKVPLSDCANPRQIAALLAFRMAFAGKRAPG